MFFLVIGWAEYGALHALDRGHGTHREHANAVGALLIQGVLVFFAARGWRPGYRRGSAARPDDD